MMVFSICNVGPYLIVCTYGSCAAGCNQEPVQALVAQVVSRYSGFANVVENYGNPGHDMVILSGSFLGGGI